MMTFPASLRRVLPVLLLPFLFTACDSNKEDNTDLPVARVVADEDFTVTDSGLKYYDFKAGTGETAQPGDLVSVDYNGWLEDGQLFDSSYLRGRPITFALGVGQVIDGWDEGLDNMKVGGERQLVIPPSLAYGAGGSGPIPPNATLIFEVELVSVTHAAGAASE